MVDNSMQAPYLITKLDSAERTWKELSVKQFYKPFLHKQDPLSIADIRLLQASCLRELSGKGVLFKYCNVMHFISWVVGFTFSLVVDMNGLVRFETLLLKNCATQTST